MVWASLWGWGKIVLGYSFGLRDLMWMTGGSLCILLYGIFFGKASFRSLRNILIGMEGEITVGAMLEDLRKHDYIIMHDIPIVSSTGITSKGISGLMERSSVVANIDHIAIGPAGVFAFETKMRSKPKDKAMPAKITADANGRLLVAGFPQEPDPRSQAKQIAKELGRIIKHRTDMHLEPRPVVVFPDWWVEETINPKGANEGAWVLNPSRVFAWITTETRIAANRDTALDPSEIKRIAAALTDHIHANSN